MAVTRLQLPRDREALDTHYGALSTEDLRLRFCSPVGTNILECILGSTAGDGCSVVWHLQFSSELVAVGHYGAFEQPSSGLEVGLSVLESYRRQGLGSALIQRAARYARSRRFKSLVVYCLAENTAMLSLAKHLGISSEISKDEAFGRVQIGTGTFLDYWSELYYLQADMVDALVRRWQFVTQSALTVGARSD